MLLPLHSQRFRFAEWQVRRNGLVEALGSARARGSVDYAEHGQAMYGAKGEGHLRSVLPYISVYEDFGYGAFFRVIKLNALSVGSWLFDVYK